MEVTAEVHAQKLDKMHMKGKEIFKVAVSTLADFAREALESNGLKLRGHRLVDPPSGESANHRSRGQAPRLPDGKDPRQHRALRQHLGRDRADRDVDEAVRDGKIKPGQIVLLDVFGAGLTYGSVLLRW